MTKKELMLSAILGVFLFAVIARANLSTNIDTLYAQTAVRNTIAQTEPDSDSDDGNSDDDNSDNDNSDSDDNNSSDNDNDSVAPILNNLKPDSFDFSYFLELLFPDNFRRDGNGIDLLITIPDFDFALAFQAASSENDPLNDPSIALAGQLAFTVEEEMVFTMQATEPIPLPLSLVFAHRVENGLLQFDVVSGEFGPFDLPANFTTNIGNYVNDLCAGILNQGFSNFSVQDAHFDDGSITITIRRLQ